MKDVYLAKINPDQNEYRMYRLCLPEQSRELLQQWGRIGDYVYEKWDGFDSHNEALKQFERLEKAKRSEDYITADQAVMPRNHLFYEQPEGAMEAGGQLSFFEDV